MNTGPCEGMEGRTADGRCYRVVFLPDGEVGGEFETSLPFAVDQPIPVLGEHVPDLFGSGVVLRVETGGRQLRVVFRGTGGFVGTHFIRIGEDQACPNDSW